MMGSCLKRPLTDEEVKSLGYERSPWLLKQVRNKIGAILTKKKNHVMKTAWDAAAEVLNTSTTPRVDDPITPVQ